MFIENGKKKINEEERTKFFKSKWIRVAGALDIPGCTKYIERIDRDITKLTKLFQNTAKLEQPRRARRQKDNANYWISIRDHAQQIYQNLEAIWSQSCGCQHMHRASIHLDRKAEEWNSAQPDLHFRLIMSFDKVQDSSQPPALPWRWRDIEIKSECVAK